MKRIVLTTIQILVTLGLLYLVFHDPHKRAQMAAALKTADYVWLIPSALSVGAAFLLQTQRWRLLLRVQGVDMGWWRTVRVYFIGAFFNLFLPGNTGGDLVKIFYAMRETASKKSGALLSVLVDRMMGLVALVAVASVLCSLRFPLINSHPATRALLGTLVLILGGSFALVVAGFLVDRFHLAKKIPHWLPLHAKIVDLSAAFSIYARDPKVLGATFGLSVPAHLLIFLSIYFVAQAFGILPGLGGLVDIFSVLPIINTIAALPVSVAGIGVRENLFQQIFLDLFGTPESVAAMVSLTGFLMQVFWGLIGGAIYMMYRPSGGLHLKEMEEEVAEIEETIEEQVEKQA